MKAQFLTVILIFLFFEGESLIFANVLIRLKSSYSASSYWAEKFLLGAQVLIRHTSSYWAHPLIKVKELRFQSHALHIDKFFYQDMK